MKRILSLVAFFATLQATAQQVNPVPDYVFRNQMSVGRNAVTDTAAYFSIGPRYGANKGFMPPIVGDTATFSSGKRNGLLIFSVQKNKFLYWDSVRVQWSDMAGSSGAYIVAGDTATMLAPYLRKADTTSMLASYLRKSDTLTLSNRINLKLNATDTASLSNRINLKLNISDTASMLSPYYRSAPATAALATKLNISDTATMLSPYARTATVNASLANKLNISDTSTMLSPYLRKVDTTAMLSPYYRSATATAALALKVNISDTSTMLGNYVRHAGYGLTKSGQSFIVDTAAMATRSRVQKGIDSVAALVGSGTIGGSGTTNYVPKFTASTTIGNSQIFDNGTQVGINTASPASRLHAFGTSGATTIIAEGGTNNTAYGRFEMRGRPAAANQSTGYIVAASTEGGQAATNIGTIDFAMSGASGNAHYMAFSTHNGTSLGERLRIFANGRVGVNTTTDAGYQLDINGTLRSVNGANFATTSGNVGIGTASPISKLHAFGSGGSTAVKLTLSNGGDVNSLNDPMGVIDFYSDDASGGLQGTKGYVGVYNEFNGNWDGSGSRYDTYMAFGTSIDNSLSEKMRVKSDAELLINTTTDAGDYKLQVAGNIYNTGSAVLAATSGNVGIGTASPFIKLESAVNGANTVITAIRATNSAFASASPGQGVQIAFANDIGFNASAHSSAIRSITTNTTNGASDLLFLNWNGSALSQYGRINSAGEWLLNADGTDAGDYKLQVVGNARIGTGKLDIASNTTFGLGVARSGTSEVAGQVYNSNGILYTGVESSAGGQIFTGSSAYAAVIGSGANYPLQFAVNNATYATLNTNGRLLINTKYDNGAYPLQVAGSVYNTGQVTRGVVNVQGTNGQVFVDSTTNLSPFAASQTLSGSNASPLFSGNVTWNTTGNPSAIDVYVTNTASGANANFINVGDGTNNFKVTKDAGIITANPTSGTATKWKLGSVVATNVQLDTSNYIEVEINGTFYRLAIVTPL